jgi:hypothetical protein
MATSAVLAVLSTPALAQDTAPAPGDTILVTPQSSAPASLPGAAATPAPVIPATPEQVIAPPPVMVSPIPPQPLEPVEAVSASEPPPARVVKSEPVAKPEATARNRAAAEAPLAADAQRGEMTGSAETAMVASSTGSPAVASAEPAKPAAPEPRSNGMSDEAIAGLLALLGVGAAGGLLAMKRRRRPLPPAPVRQDTAFASEGPAPPLASAATIVTKGPDARHDAGDMTGEPCRPRSSRKAVHEAALAQMADGPVPTGHERAELIRSMTRAKPDRFNPFTSPKARRRRARLILQHRERLWEERVNRPLDLGRFQPARHQRQEERQLVDA